MANRVVLGNANGEYGLYVSQKDDNVVSPSKQLSFDSRAFNGLPVHYFNQGTIDAPSGGASFRATPAIGYTNLGFSPLFALRYSFAGDITSDKATKVYSPAVFGGVESVNNTNGQTEEETVYTETKSGGASAVAGASSIVIKNHYGGKTVVVTSVGAGAPSVVTNQNAQLIKYAFIIFGVEDFTGGTGI